MKAGYKFGIGDEIQILPLVKIVTQKLVVFDSIICQLSRVEESEKNKYLILVVHEVVVSIFKHTKSLCEIVSILFHPRPESNLKTKL